MELNLTPRWKKEVNLIMTSGGIDSAYLLYQRLKDTDIPIHAHHINFITQRKSYRYDVERDACNKIWNYLSKIRKFSHSTSVIDLTTFPYTGWDTDTQLFIGSRVAANLTCDKVTLELGINADDLLQEDIQERVRRGTLPKLWDSILYSLDEVFRNKISDEISMPLKNMTKREILDAMPQELIDLTWSCRDPVRDGEHVKPCGKCHACKQLTK